MKFKIIPKFSTREIIDSTIRKDWFRIQNESFNLGDKLHQYMISYIERHKHRKLGSTGKLAKSINIEKYAGAGLGKVYWGIGNIRLLNSEAPYWYWANYGGQIPGGAQWRPVMFGSNRADARYRGQGIARATAFKKIDDSSSVPSPARPINYIQATRNRLTAYIRTLLNK